MSMSNASIPVFEVGLNALSALLDKAEDYAKAKSLDATVLLNARLFPDMFAFTRQVQSACDQAKNGAARLAGIDPPGYEDNEKTIAELKARIAVSRHREQSLLYAGRQPFQFSRKSIRRRVTTSGCSSWGKWPHCRIAWVTRLLAISAQTFGMSNILPTA
jgi:hypothetical protein